MPVSFLSRFVPASLTGTSEGDFGRLERRESVERTVLSREVEIVRFRRAEVRAFGRLLPDLQRALEQRHGLGRTALAQVGGGEVRDRLGDVRTVA